ncbi:MAG: gluconate 2-dehydrogenase subunit 3 family protein [Bacteroidota bacterium]
MERRTALKRTALLAGASTLGPSLLSLLQSCQPASRLDWTPEFLSLEQADFFAAFVDTILPKTETPGALDVKVDLFMDLVFARLYNAAGQEQLLADIKAFDERCTDQFGQTFANLDGGQRTEFLQAEETTNAKYAPQVWGTAVGEQEPIGFYRSMKSLVIWGYFSSQEIGQNVLNYDPVPGDYRGCVPLAEIGRSWSL